MGCLQKTFTDKNRDTWWIKGHVSECISKTVPKLREGTKEVDTEKEVESIDTEKKVETIVNETTEVKFEYSSQNLWDDGYIKWETP